ncbi:class I SAM-dependent methyltransferase [Rubripirellula reticaptiva]|uniref:Methyltransferase domain-containing protein n=1 Tax=Rubripirellula reticaptiva TaxID=2528013 RepID=A0A5C6ED42_9BACT|nr:class I SAM-dependent methyltransferase [Rubripirellula reticaptiva]TWU46942.1 hypothetical protein Poly59_59160 [Rubripirellula reticaptiva]
MSKYEWLAIRETMDGRFRSARLAQQFLEHASKSRLIVDLGCGTGSNRRYLCRDCVSGVPWRCIDNDDEVLETATHRSAGRPIRFEHVELATDLLLIPIGGDVSITASAFLDITSEDWLSRFVKLAAQSPILIAMTASGAPVWDPADDLDVAIGLCLEEHQKSDHGFGPAAGAQAAPFLADKLISRECNVTLEKSDWRLGSQDAEVLAMLVDSVCRRASSKMHREQVEHWASMRQQQIRKGVLKLTLPHLDLLSLPRFDA